VIRVGGTVHVVGCPADVSHGAVRVIEIEVITTAGSPGPRAGPGMLWWQRLEPVTHHGGTNELMTQSTTPNSDWMGQDNQGLNDLGFGLGWDRVHLAPGMTLLVY
jgi:hypothetical protein